MPYLKENETMGLEASLTLLDLSPDAGIDDANRAYAHLHQMIEQYHHDPDADEEGGRQADMDLLTCAYENAVAHFSDRDVGEASMVVQPAATPPGSAPASTDLHFTLQFPAMPPSGADAGESSGWPQSTADCSGPEVDVDAEDIQQVASALAAAREDEKSMAVAVHAADQRLASAREARMQAAVAARSAEVRARLLEIEADRAMEAAIAVAEKARQRVLAARQAAGQADQAAKKAADQVGRVETSEQTAVAEARRAQDQLDQAQARVEALTHCLVEARHRLPSHDVAMAASADASPSGGVCALPREGAGEVDRHAILNDLLEIEASLTARSAAQCAQSTDAADQAVTAGSRLDRRQHERLAYPAGREPSLRLDGRIIPIVDLSATGMCLKGATGLERLRCVRGDIDFSGQRPLRITGKVVRQDDRGVGVRLVTRIAKRVLDHERMCLSA